MTTPTQTRFTIQLPIWDSSNAEYLNADQLVNAADGFLTKQYGIMVNHVLHVNHSYAQNSLAQMEKILTTFKENPRNKPNEQQIGQLRQKLYQELKKKEALISIKHLSDLKKMDYQNNNNNQRSQHIAPQILSQNNNQQQSQINVNQNNNPLSIPQSPLPSLFNVNHNNNLAPNYGNNQIGFVEIPNNQTGSVATENIQQPSTAPISKPNNNQQSNQFSSMPYFETNIQSQNQNINLNVEKDDLHSQLKQVINDSRPILSPNTENNGTSKKKSNSNNINDSINIVKIEQNDDEDGDDENGDDEDAETVTSTHSKQSSIYTPPKNNTNNNQPVSIIDSDEDSDVEIVNEPQNKPRRSIQNDRKRKLGESEDDDVQNNNADNSVMFDFYFYVFFCRK